MNIKTVSLCLLLGLICSIGNVYSQITAPAADTSFSTQYKDPDTGVLWPSNQQDNVFVFCSDVANGGSLTAPGTAGCTWQWGKYDPAGFQYVNFATSQTITGLQSGGYKVVVNCSGTISCYRAWVFVNQTIVSVDDVAAGCSPFTLHGTVNPVTDFTVYNPPADPITIDANTTITVCFTADHTWVSDLGFYLIAPTYGASCSNQTTPGNFGIVELLPSVAAWDNGVTTLPSTVFGCSNPSDIGINCNDGEDVENLCFTTSWPAGNNAYTACVCDMPTPLTGNFASCGPWSQIYGQQVPAPLGTPSNCGWSVQIYDCIAMDVGFFTNATITFSGTGPCGPATHYYDSGTISSTINDNSCDAVSASRYVIPPAQPYQYTIANTISSAVWSCSPGSWNSAWGNTNFNTNQNPNIDPIPSSSTWFYLTSTDNFGCVKVDSTQFVTQPTDATINPAGPFCSDEGNQTLTAVNSGGYWTCTNVPNFIVNASSGIVDPSIGAGIYNIQYILTGVCGDTGTTTVIVNPVISISNFILECVNSNADFRVCFDISGGSSFTVNVNGTNAPADSIVGSSFCYTIPSPGWFVFEVDNGLGCGTYKDSVYHDCGCLTNAGVVSQALQILCEGEDASTTINPGSFHSDGNDVLVYYLHEGNLATIINPVEWNTTGTFTDNNIVFGQQYYISPVAGNPDGTTGVDFNDPCLDVGVGTPVIWYQQPSANAGGNVTVCGLAAQLNAVSPTLGQGHWTSTCGSTISYSPYNDSPTANVTYTSLFNTNTTCTFTWTVVNGACTATDQTNVTFIPIPNAFAGDDDQVCGLSYDLCATLSLPAGVSNVTWSGPGSFTQNPPNCAEVTVNNYGTYMFTGVEASGSGQCTDEDYVSITFIKPPTPDANHNDSVCGDAYNLNAIGVENAGYWTGPGGAIYTSNHVPPYSPAYKDPAAHVNVTYTGTDQTYMFYWHESNSICTAIDSVSINFALPPTASIDPDQTEQFVCGNIATLVADITGSPYTYVEWFTEFPEPAIYFTNPDSIVTDIVIPTNTGIFGDSGYVQLEVYWKIKNQGCEDMDTVLVTFYQLPTPNAGIDTSACGLSIIMNGEFSILDPGSRTGQWTSISGQPSVVISQPTNPNTQITASSYNNGDPYYFVWRETNTAQGAQNCSNTDTIAVTFVYIPYIDAGDPIKHCGKIDVALNATASTVKDSAMWLSHSGVSFIGTGQYEPNGHFSTGFEGVFYLTWREWVDVCVVEDSVEITILNNPVATHTVPTWNRDICGSVDSTLTVQNPGVGYTGWWVDTVTGTSFNQTNHINVDTAFVTYYGVHNFYWIVSHTLNNYTCYDTSEVVPITFWEIPDPDAGVVLDTACGTCFTLHGTQSVSGSTITWSSVDGDLDFYSTNWGPTGNTIIDSVCCPITNTTRQIILTEAVGPGGMCSANDLITLKFARIPEANYSYIQPDCYGGSFIFNAVEDTLPTYVWNFESINGIIDSTGYESTNGQGPIYVHWPIDADSVHYVCLISTNSYKCSSPAFCDSVDEPPRINIHFNITPSKCADNNGSVTAWTTGGKKPSAGYVQQWLPNAQITNVNNTTQTNMYSGVYYFQATDYYNCVVVDSAVIPNTGMVTADFDVIFPTDNSGGIDSVADVAMTFNNNSIDGTHFVWYFNNAHSGNITISDINYGTGQAVTLDPSVTFNGTAVIVEDFEPSFTYTSGGDFWIFLAAISDSGCVDTLTKWVTITEKPTVEVPNVFTPNGDGVNDIFTIKTQSLEVFKGVIFDRWGKKIYEWDGIEETGWDGTIKGKGGAKATPGTYYYIINAVGSDDEKTEFEFKGYVTLIRN